MVRVRVTSPLKLQKEGKCEYNKSASTCHRRVGQDPPLWYDHGLQILDVRLVVFSRYSVSKMSKLLQSAAELLKHYQPEAENDNVTSRISQVFAKQRF